MATRYKCCRCGKRKPLGSMDWVNRATPMEAAQICLACLHAEEYGTTISPKRRMSWLSSEKPSAVKRIPVCRVCRKAASKPGTEKCERCWRAHYAGNSPAAKKRQEQAEQLGIPECFLS